MIIIITKSNESNPHLGLTLCIALATNGVDLADCFNDFTCLKQSGESFVIARAWRSYGVFETCGPSNIQNARNAGIEYVDVYMFPCRGLSASSQVSSLISGLSSALGEEEFEVGREMLESSYGMIWLDIEINPSGGCGWGTDY